MGACSESSSQSYNVSNSQENGKGWTCEGRREEFGALYSSCPHKIVKGLPVIELPAVLVKIIPKEL